MNGSNSGNSLLTLQSAYSSSPQVESGMPIEHNWKVAEKRWEARECGQISLFEESMDRVSMGEIRRDLEGMRKVLDLTAADVLALPHALKLLLRWIVLSKAVTCEQVAAFLQESQEEALSLIDELCNHGLVERLPICGAPRYWVCLNPRRLKPPQELLNMI